MGKRILLVDDAHVFRKLERSIFRRTGATFDSAHSCEEALQKIRTSPPDAILVCMDMPDMPGDSLCLTIKSDPALHHLPVILVLPQGDPEIVERCERAKCDDYIIEPLEEQQMLMRVARLLKIPYRQTVRILVRLEIIGEKQREVFFGSSEDISKSGMYIETERPLKIDDVVMLRFVLPEKQQIELEAKVVRKEVTRDTGGYGVRFKDVTLPVQNAINRFIENRNK